MRSNFFAKFDELPPHYDELLEAAGTENFYYSFPWYRNLIDTTSHAEEQLVICGVESPAPTGSPIARALIVLRKRVGTQGVLRPRELHLFENVYTLIAGPVIRPDESNIDKIMQTLAAKITTELSNIDVIQLGSMDPNSVAYDALKSAFQKPGFMVRGVHSFINWYEPTKGISYDQYHSSLSGKMRNLLKRRNRKLEKAGNVRWKLTKEPAEIPSAMADYSLVYANSWKTPEIYPNFIEGFVKACAEMNVLRLGILYLDDQPTAAQIWTVTNGQATIYKLAYDEKFKALSVGSALTARMMEHVLEKEGLSIVDFGYGDDPYKKDWTRQRRDRMGLLIFNLRTVRGNWAAGKFTLKLAVTSVKEKILGKT
ncbi:MAG: GNAT family N-acetyltransferase [Alphaproteobacteria bacterium]|nr:GNAT family N-acetyltransferase [Alphaproteobacteria bacterium]